MLVKITVSAAGDRFTLNYGKEMEWAELKALIGNGAENFCSPVDDTIEWPPVAASAVAPIERAVANPVIETADKPQFRKGRNR